MYLHTYLGHRACSSENIDIFLLLLDIWMDDGIFVAG